MKRIGLILGLIVLSGSLAHAQGPAATPAGTRTITLSWPAVASATGYIVYKAQTGCAGATLTKYQSVTTTTFSDTGLPDGATRCYYVTATNAAGESTPSGTIQVTTSSYTAPVAAAIPAPPSLAATTQ